MQHNKFKLVNYVYSQAITVLNMCYVPRIRGANQVSLRRCNVESCASEEFGSSSRHLKIIKFEL